MSARDRVAAVAARYDSEGLLSASALRRLEWRLSRSGRRCAGPCGQVRSISDFGLDSREPDALHRVCRSCRAGHPETPPV